MIIAGTGHRPPRLGLDYDKASREKLVHFVYMVLESLKNIDTVISGLAQGFDQALAQAAIKRGIPLIAAVPFVGQETKWPENAKREYWWLITQAEKVIFVSEGGPSKGKYIVRDHWMVDQAEEVIALLDDRQEGSGTLHTVRYAEKQGKRVTNVWSEWTRFLGGSNASKPRWVR